MATTFDPVKLQTNINSTRKELDYKKDRLAYYEEMMAKSERDSQREMYAKWANEAREDIAKLEKRLAKYMAQMEANGHTEETLNDAVEEAKYQKMLADLEEEKRSHEHWEAEAAKYKELYEQGIDKATSKQRWYRAEGYAQESLKSINLRQKKIQKVEEERARKAAKANGTTYDDGRNVKPLRDFLDQWKEKVYKGMLEEMKSQKRLSLQAEVKKAKEAWTGYSYASKWLPTKEEENEKAKLHDLYVELHQSYTEEYGQYDMFEIQANAKKQSIEEYLDDMLSDEWVRKYDDLLYRIEKHVGKLADASYLSVGKNGSINGRVVGEDGRQAYVETIIAGGPIQCLHYRVLIKPIRK